MLVYRPTLIFDYSLKRNNKMVYFEKGAFSHRLQVFHCILCFHNVVNCTSKKMNVEEHSETQKHESKKGNQCCILILDVVCS